MTDPDRRPLPDAADRRLAIDRFDVPVLLEAGAGTGKTTALVARLLAWTLGAGWEEAARRLGERARSSGRAAPTDAEIAAAVLDGVVAITFTEAAAAEMAERLGRALAAMAVGQTTAELAALEREPWSQHGAQRAARLLEQLGRARIQTLHSFCRALLAAHPFEAGIHPAFDVDADESALERIAGEVLAEQLVDGLGGDDPGWLELLTDGHEPEDLLEALHELARAGLEAADLDRDPFPETGARHRLEEASQAFAALARALGSVVDKLAPRSREDTVQPVLDLLRPLIDGPARAGSLGEALEAAAAGAEDLLDQRRPTLRTWSNGDNIAAIEKHLPAEHAPFAGRAGAALRAAERLRGLSPARLHRARNVLRPLLAEVRERMRGAGQLLFEELVARAERLLAERPEVAAAARRGIRQLLVDEFQDTDRRQCAIVERLALDGEPSERPGLFLVGDPKQSIYGFRSADLAAYEEFVARASRAGAIRGRLSVNFRSIPALLAEVERVVAGQLVHVPGLQPAYEGLLASERNVERGAELAWRPAVEYWHAADPTRGDDTPAGLASRIEASAIAADLRRQRDEDPSLRWEECALLSRTTTDLEVYLQALREAAIPFAVERDRSYWRRREVIDAAAAVRTVVDPGDHLALLTLLRSPFVGVPDAALVPLWRAGLPLRIDRLLESDAERLAELGELLGAVAAELPGDVPGLERVAGWEASALAALEAIAELRAAFGELPGEDFVERLRARLAPEPTAAARFLGRFGLANLERFFRELAGALEDGGDDPAAVARFLRRAVTERRAAEEARPPAGGIDAVRVMTLHKSKGLEFRHVHLVQLHKGTGGRRRQEAFAAERAHDGTWEYCLLGASTLGWADVSERREAIEAHEQVRLLYVGMTRARERLVLGGQMRSTRLHEGSLLELIRPRLDDSPLAELAAGSVETERRDDHGTLWRVVGPAPFRHAEGGESARAGAGEGNALDAAEIELEELTRRRREAAARQARVRVERASELAHHEPDDEAPFPPPGSDGEPAIARARGSALHRALELAPQRAGDPDGWRARARAAFLAERPDAAPADLDALDRELDRLLSTALWRRLGELEPHVLARELPLLVAAEPSALEGPTDAFVGRLDLLYRDPVTREIAVVDFKSDSIAGADEAAALAAAAESYAAQLRLYGEAVRSALGLAAPPRLELWHLGADRAVVVEPAPDAG